MQNIIKKLFLSSAILFSAAALFQSCKSNDSTDADTQGKYIMPDSLFRTLTIDTVTKCPLVNTITLTGQVAFNDDKVSKIYPMVSGTIEDIHVMLGDYVTAGQTLGVIRSPEMAGYSNNLTVAETNLTTAKKQLDAAKDLFKSGLSSQLDVTSAQTSYDQAEAQLELAKRVLTINGGGTQGVYEVKAPISGFVVEKFVTNDMAIRTDNGTNLFTICDLSDVWIMANVYESNIGKVHLGDSVNVTTLSYPDKVFKGKIDKILNVLDPTNKVMKVRVVLQNPGYLLKPQMFASVTIDTKENQEAICVPSNALVFDNSQYYVLVYKSKSDIEIKPVRIINAIGSKTYISAGVDEGDIIITSQAVLIYQALNA